ncbi:MAG: DUF4393 domain-containing protein, partial [Rhizobium sp.]|nr:DUF4393 domain-containing protein [Rhizobium sp.]
PTKFLVDWVEKASLEDSNDSELTDMWAGLLLSSSSPDNPAIFYFKRILSEMTSAHLKLLSLICDHDFSHFNPYTPGTDFIKWEDLEKYTVERKLTFEDTEDSVVRFLEGIDTNRLKIRSFEIESHVGLFKDKRIESTKIRSDIEEFVQKHVEKFFIDAGVLRIASTTVPIDCPSFERDRRYNLNLSAIFLTAFGVDFLKACRPSSAEVK